MKYSIPRLSWCGSAVEVDIPDDTPESERLRVAVVAAVQSGADLDGADLDGADLDGADLAGAYLTRANLAEANLTRANLAEANLTRANLTRANLAEANLAGANLDGANLTRANLDGADLDGGARLVGTDPILMAGPLGSRGAYLRLNRTDQGIRVDTGCFHGSYEEFMAAVEKTHGDGLHGRRYRVMAEAMAIALCEDDEPEPEKPAKKRRSGAKGGER